MMSRAGVLLPLLTSATVPSDKGYELLFEDAVEEYDGLAKGAPPLTFTGGAIPDYVRGTYIQTGPARWSWKANESFTRRMTHALDGYGKVHRWAFRDDGSVVFTSKFLRSGFLNKSQTINDIAFNVMAQPTDPPLTIPELGEFQNTPNDNNNVNVFELGGGIEVMSDTNTLVEIDPVTLEKVREYNNQVCPDWSGGEGGCTTLGNMTDDAPFEIPAGGSAHPWRTDSGDYMSLRETARVSVPGLNLSTIEKLAIYTIKKGSKGVVHDVVPIRVNKSSYTHSWGLAKAVGGADHAVIAQQPIHYDAMTLASTGTLQAGFVTTDETTRFYVTPVEYNATVVEVDAPRRFFFGHFVNSYSTGAGKFVADINAQDNIFFDRYDLTVQRTKALRDAWPTRVAANATGPNGYQTVTRYEIDTVARTCTAAPLFGTESRDNVFNEHDLFRLHPADYGRPYCGYWAWQAYYNSTSFASWAVVRAELCGPRPVVAAAWHRPNVYPGEAAFVPKPGATDKTEGVLLFKALDGNTGKSIFVVADARSLETIAEAELPVAVPYAVHGNWFPAE